MVTDVGMSKYTLDVAGEMGIPAVSLETSGACEMMGYLQTRQLLDKGIIPLRGRVHLISQHKVQIYISFFIIFTCA